MSTARTAGRKNQTPSNSTMVAELVKHIEDSLLPGTNGYDDADLDEIARFMLDTATVREPGEAAIELASASGGRRFMRIAIVNDDMPFLVDSIASAIAAQSLVIDRMVHPVVPVRRDSDGRLKSLPDGAAEGELHESMIYVETARVDARQRRVLQRALSVTLADVRAAVADWPRMTAALAEDSERIADAEGAALLRWLNEGMLTQLGHVTRRRDGSSTQRLGICRKSARAILADNSFDRAFDWFSRSGPDERGRAPLVVKANVLSTVHRRVPIDLFIVPLIEEGGVAALSVHAGIWTSAALNTPPARVPRMRQQLAALVERLGFDPDSHTGKSLTHALTTLPHDLVIGFSDEDVARVATAMTELTDRPRPRLTLVEAPLARHLFAFVWLPRDMLSTQVRLAIQNLLEEETGAPALDWSLQVEGGALATLRYVLDIREGIEPPDEKSVDQRLQSMLRGWGEAVEVALREGEDASRAAAVAARYAESFPAAYRTAYGAAEAARDIARIRRLAIGESTGPDGQPFTRAARLYRLEGDPSERLRLKVYQNQGDLPLSDAVPAIETFGFEVIAEIPTQLDGGRFGSIHDFTLGLPPGEDAQPLLERAGVIEEAIAAVLNSVAENDAFNRLVVSAGLEAFEAQWLRALYRYLRQAGMGFTVRTVVDALGRAPVITRALIEFFRARHDPSFSGDRGKAADEAREAIRTGLIAVAAINDDRLLRLYASTLEAILRTNAFVPRGGEALAFKIDSAGVPGLPLPVPWREIFVYSRRVEGIHLRAGRVARGGIRWSDRRDDFRTEVLGLMKAQRVKNAVIVPTGAKGGFYPKQLPDPARNREGWAQEGRESYECFIRSLLSITDNIVGGKVVHPEGVVVHDGEDPYFVVAADKGTARFSDVANAIATSRDFWLDDAFASGGSNGYDHKAMGITARGAWISVQRHFIEMGIDVQTDPIRVTGCGDMSGDVFGNGMLLSKAIRLIAAFDHRHVFLDPDPDPAAAWTERKRLFDLPHSSWADYDEKLISKGGGVFPRSMKRVPLSPPVRRMLGVDVEEMEPDALIAAILAAPADLLWFGGIGTYVKSRSENDVQVGDPVNDSLRVDARDLRVKVIGEGANLGVTQAGRIEFALHANNGRGGRINTDFIDNSAGVDCSDNEVNIKIALASARRAGKLPEAKRNALLAEMTDEVAAIVLEDNRLQALALSIAESGGHKATAAQTRLIEMLEDTGTLDRQTEGLADAEALARRAAEGAGLTRPELAVLLSNTKLVLQDAIEQSGLPDDPGLVDVLMGTFPEPMREKYARFIKSHRLRREIIATEIANRIVNRLGLVHPFELTEEEGVDLASVAAAFVLAVRLFDLDAIWHRLDTASMDEDARLMLFARLSAAIRSHMADLLRAGAGKLPPSELIARLAEGVAGLTSRTSELLSAEARQQSSKLRASLTNAGAPENEAAAVAELFDLDGAVGIADLAVEAKIDPRRLTAAFIDLGERLGLDWAQGIAAIMNPSDPWERLLVAGLARDFQQMRLDFLRALARRKTAREAPEAAVEKWAEDHTREIARFRAVVGRAQSTVPVAPAMLAQIASQARNLLNR